MIDIITPIYNDRKHLPQLLASIAMQTIKDKTIVYLIDDNSTENYDDILAEYNEIIKIEYLKLDKNIGAGIAREYGLTHSKNPYIFFIDSDDLLCNPRSLEELFNYTSLGFEFISGKEYDEAFNSIEYNTSDLHGKLYSRAFIEKNNIHFINTRYHEDCYFNCIYNICSPKTLTTNTIVYFYTYNSNSLTSIEYERVISNIEILLQNLMHVIDFANKRNISNYKIKAVLKQQISYIDRVYDTVDDYDKSRIEKWIKKYNLSDFFSNMPV